MRKPLSYTVTNKLNMYLEEAKERREEKLGRKIAVSEIEQELADYCNIKRDSVYTLKRGKSNAGLPLALKICEYFGVKFKDIFEISELEDDALSLDFNSVEPDVLISEEQFSLL